MATGPICHQPATTRDGFDPRGPQCFVCCWYIDEVFLVHGTVKRYLYRAVDEDGQVVDVLLRERLDLASARAFFRRALATAEPSPRPSSPIHHQPYVRAADRDLQPCWPRSARGAQLPQR